MDSWTSFALLVGVGVVAGTLNVLAGGGSFLTLPTLIFLGLPPGVANATNRVAILLQNVGAAWSFRAYGVLDLRSLLWAAAPACAGSVLGTWMALTISDDAFRKLLAFLMVALTLWTLWSSRGGAGTDAAPAAPRARLPMLVAGFFAVGVYGGFVQAGVGFLVLAVTSAAGLDLVRGNAVKVLSILCVTAVALAIFIAQGRVEWVPGLSLAVGNVVGGLLGARLTVLKGHRWVRGVVTVTVLVFALKLWLDA